MIEVNYNEYKETIAENMKLIIENHDLKEKINKAIEYIEENMDNFEIPWKTVLYDILKGVDKDGI